METSNSKGNCPDQWDKLLQILDDKLQLGLLDKLRRVNSYHLEEDTLFIEPMDHIDAQYFQKEPVMQQLSLFVEETFGSVEVKIQSHQAK